VKPTAAWKSELLLCLLLSLALSVFVCFVSDRLLNRQARRSEAIEMELAILNGQPFHESGNLTYMPAFQNRILFPALLKLGSRLGIFTVAGWYVFVRLLSALAMFFAFWYVLRINTGAGVKLTGAGLLSLAYCLVFTFSLPLVLTSDFPDAMFACLFVFAALQRRRWLLLLLSVVAATNRESAAFAGVIWFFLYGIKRERRIDIRESGFAALVSVCSYATTLLLRYELGGWKAIGHTQSPGFKTNIFLLSQYVQHPLAPFSGLSLILCMITPFVLWIFYNRRALTTVQKRLLLASVAIAAASLIFGIVSEPRIFIPSVVLLLIVAVWAEATSESVNQLPSSAGT